MPKDSPWVRLTKEQKRKGGEEKPGLGKTTRKRIKVLIVKKQKKKGPLTRAGYLREYLENKTEPQAGWTLEVMVGYFIHLTDADRHTPLAMSRTRLKALVTNVKTAMDREGAEDTMLAIKVLITEEKLDWVDRKDSFLAHIDNYGDYVAPMVARHKKKRKSGEQSEWRKSRGVSSSRKV